MPKTQRVSSSLTTSSSYSSNPYPLPSLLVGGDGDVKQKRMEEARTLFNNFNPLTVFLPSPPCDESLSPLEIIDLDAENKIVVFNSVASDLCELAELCLRNPEYGLSAMMGHPVPRYAANFAPTDLLHAGGYTYGGKKNACAPLDGIHLNLFRQSLSYMEKMAPSCFKNTNYRDGASFAVYNVYPAELKGCGSIAAHSDNEFQKFKGFDPAKEETCWGLVYSFSLGMKRTMVFRSKENTKRPPIKVPLRPNSIVAMIGPSFQLKYTHEVPKLTATEQKQGPLATRMSATFRAFNKKV